MFMYLAAVQEHRWTAFQNGVMSSVRVSHSWSRAVQVLFNAVQQMPTLAGTFKAGNGQENLHLNRGTEYCSLLTARCFYAYRGVLGLNRKEGTGA